jgi:hypothetical protein
MEGYPIRTPSATTIAARCVLPVSGTSVALRQPTGAEDLLLAEANIDDPAIALTIARRLVRADRKVDWDTLTPTDLDVLLLQLRKALIGNRIVAEVTCRAAGCGSRIDMSFEVEAYLAHQQPRRAPLRRRGSSVESCAEEPGWFLLHARGLAQPVRFRLPTVADQVAVFERPDALQALTQSCIQPPALPARLRGHVEAAMEALAPPLAGDLQGQCPECAAVVTARFAARRYCLQELRDRARFVYDDIDVLAQRYHWSERAILRMSNVRRKNYAELARGAT